MAFPSITPLLEGYKEDVPNTSIRSTMDTGPAKARQRTTAGVRNISMVYLLGASDMAALESFYLNDCAGGSLSFAWTNPRTLASCTARFTAPPSYTPVAGSYYDVAVTLEVLP